MAELVTSESRRYLHGIQNTIISDDDTGVALNIIPSDSQLALVDKMEVDGTLTVYGDAYVTSSKNTDSLSGVNHNAIAGRDVYAAHPASSVALVPVGSVVATDMQSAVAELDAGKVASNPSLSPSTKTKITYDSKGLVTSGSDATASDIANVPYGGVVAVNVQDAINAVESHAASSQTAANNAATAAAAAQTAANAANAAAAYADRLARSSYNLIKNGNSEDANPTGYEAQNVASDYPFSGSKYRRIILSAGSGTQFFYVTPLIQCSSSEQFHMEAMTAIDPGDGERLLFVDWFDAAGGYMTTTDGTSRPTDGYIANAPNWRKQSVDGTAPAGAAYAQFGCKAIQGASGGVYVGFDCLYACRKVSAGMLEADAVRSTTHAFIVSDTTASTSTTTGAIVAAGGIATGDCFTGRYRSQDGSAGITGTMTFYAASSSGGSATVLNTVVVKNGIITSWTQA